MGYALYCRRLTKWERVLLKWERLVFKLRGNNN